MTTFSFQWLRGGAAISGATGNTYTLTAADVGTIISVSVTDTNAAGLASTATASGVGPIIGIYNTTVMSSLQFTSINGQSLAQTHNGGMNETLASPFAAKAFPHTKTTTTYSDVITNVIATDLTISGGSIAREDGEAPIFGQIAFGYELARPVFNLDTTPRVGVDKGYGATTIAVHVKGQTYYTDTISTLTAAKNYATSLGLPIFDMGLAWFQGESDVSSTKATYQGTLQQLARDYATDRKAITGQTDEPAMFSYCTDSNVVGSGTRSGIARAQFQSAMDYFNGVVPSGQTVPSPVIFSSPTYHLPHMFDGAGVHVGADGAYLLGAYVSLAQYHCYMKASALPLSQRWPPIMPTAVTFAGGVATITYQMRIAGTALAFGALSSPRYPPNGDAIALQQDYGFAVWNGSALVSLSSVTLVGSNQIQITLASGSFGNGYRIGYALDRPADHNLYFIGSAGNVRDNYGATALPGARCTAMNWPMHNWLAPHDINVGASNTWTLS
jgi:hypothetical protein